MKDEIIRKLPEPLNKYLCTLRKASLDDTNRVCMCESRLQVINFDKMPNEFSRGKGWAFVPKSNDALYIDDEQWFFIEFKNGNVDKADIYRKAYDSLIMLIEMGIIEDLEFPRRAINYILVYNAQKYSKVQVSEARENMYNHFYELANLEERLFEVDKFEGYLFHETHTYTKELFEKNFVSVMEQREQLE